MSVIFYKSRKKRHLVTKLLNFLIHTKCKQTIDVASLTTLCLYKGQISECQVSQNHFRHALWGRIYKSVDQNFDKIRIFARFLPYSPACLNFYTAISWPLRQVRLRGKGAKIRILPKNLVHTFVRPHRSASDSTLENAQIARSGVWTKIYDSSFWKSL